MRNYLLKALLFFSFLFSTMIANPIFTPDAYLSEVTFGDSGTWRLELFYDFVDSYGAFPWFFKYSIETNSGMSNITYLDSTEEYIEISNDNLDHDLTINKLADSVKLIVHNGNPYDPAYIDYLVIGEEDGSYIKSIQVGQSVSRIIEDYSIMLNWDLFYKSNIPTICAKNDTGDAKGTVYGYAHYHDGQVIANKAIWIEEGYPESIETDENGYFCSRLLSRTYDIDSLWVQNLEGRGGEGVNFNPFIFDLEVGDSLRIDFHQIETSIRRIIKNNTILFNNYPHPASSYTWFFIDNIDIEASAMRVNVYALNGRKVDSFKPRAYQYRYDCSHLPQGSYIMSLQHGREILATKKLQILK